MTFGKPLVSVSNPTHFELSGSGAPSPLLPGQEGHMRRGGSWRGHMEHEEWLEHDRWCGGPAAVSRNPVELSKGIAKHTLKDYGLGSRAGE